MDKRKRIQRQEAWFRPGIAGLGPVATPHTKGRRAYAGAEKRLLLRWKDYQTRPLTSNALTNWANRNPATWAVVTGTVSGVVVLDFDGDGSPCGN